ncbi:hypothetical protein [Vibrio sp. B181a]|uniref:hypothetical protein n=1 Tax=Vibrio sp. B181a TaxID=2835906 RepID=UPI0025547AA9|nr:hypothetical protein [Vibrio sp. B181a]
MMSKTEKSNKPKKVRHILLPSEALMTIDLLHTLLPETGMSHVAFLCGISVKTLEKFHAELMKVANGDIEACQAYNSRSQFMRTLYGYYRLLECDRNTVVYLIQDAKENSNPKFNALSKRNRAESLCGLNDTDQMASILQLEKYMEN